MIERTIIELIEKLIKDKGLSQRQIAKIMKVSRGTVHAVAREKRTLKRAKSNAQSFVSPQGKPSRCPYCGANVQMPCLSCQIYGYYNQQMES